MAEAVRWGGLRPTHPTGGRLVGWVGRRPPHHAPPTASPPRNRSDQPRSTSRGRPMSRLPSIPAADLALLRKYDTPTVCNVIELFDVQPRTAGYMDGRIRACFPKLPPMVGYAATATFRSAAPPRTGNVYSGLTEQVKAFAELPGSAGLVFQRSEARRGGKECVR